MDVDPVASLRCWAIGIELAGREHTIPALPAADWLPVLLGGDVMGVLNLTVSTGEDPVSDALLDGRLTIEELAQALTDAVEEAAGRSWWASCLIVGVARTHWAELSGDLVRRGLRWDEVPLGAALDALYALICSRIEDQAKLDEFRAVLDRPGGKSDPEQAMTQFEAMAGPRPSGASAMSKGGQTPRSGVSPRRERSSAEPSGSEPAKTPRPRRPRRPRVL